MGWTAGHLQGPFTARTAIEFDLGAEFAARIIDTVRYGKVIYAAIRARDSEEFAEELTFTNGEAHSTFTYEGGSRFRTTNGFKCRVRCWQELDFSVRP
jgi:hypothetical protein